MTTFSQLVDDVTTELLRPDLRAAAATYLNQTVREMHMRPGSANAVKFDANRVEDELPVNTDGMWLWPIPFSTRFQDVEVVYSPRYGMQIPRRNPMVAARESFEPFPELFWYRSGPSIVFSGVASGDTLKLSYFAYPASLVYEPVTTRTITFDPATGAYTLAGGGTPTEEQLDKVTHWMLQRWEMVLAEGIRTKIFKRIGDNDRGRLAFSSYESQRLGVWQGEPSS